LSCLEVILTNNLIWKFENIVLTPTSMVDLGVQGFQHARHIQLTNGRMGDTVLSVDPGRVQRLISQCLASGKMRRIPVNRKVL